MFRNNLKKLKQKMSENNIDLAVITDDDSLYYFTGYHYFLHMDFNRPTILLVPKDDESTLITPLLDVLLVPEDTPVDNIVTRKDGIGDEWREFLPKFIKQNKNIACEKYKINATVSGYLSDLMNNKSMENITPIISNIWNDSISFLNKNPAIIINIIPILIPNFRRSLFSLFIFFISSNIS